MSPDRSPLPDFENPPVVEVALSVQFKPLTKLKCVHLGLLWKEFKKDFPSSEELPPLPSVMERFGPPAGPGRVGLQIETTPPLPRCWFLNNDRTRLVQVQHDRFVYNWRKVEGTEEYPRYGSIREPFARQIKTFSKFLEREDIGNLEPVQCEVTYVNHIFRGDGWEEFGQLGNVLTVWETRHSDDFLGESEQVRFAAQHVIPDNEGNPLGRLHIAVEPRYRVADGKPLLQLNLTARGMPTGNDADGVLGFMDIGHEWIVRGFASITTARMHEIWGRRNDH